MEPAIKHRELGSVLRDYLDGWDQRGQKEVQKEGSICVHAADSPHCTAVTNTMFIKHLCFIKKSKNGNQRYLAEN